MAARDYIQQQGGCYAPLLIYLESLLQFDDKPPVISGHVIHEVLLQQLNRLPGYLADQ